MLCITLSVVYFLQLACTYILDFICSYMPIEWMIQSSCNMLSHCLLDTHTTILLVLIFMRPFIQEPYY